MRPFSCYALGKKQLHPKPQHHYLAKDCATFLHSLV